MDSRTYLSLSTEELVIKRFECKNKNEMNLIDTLLKVREEERKEREKERERKEREKERKEREEERQLEFARIQIQMKKLEIQMSIGNNPSSSN